MELEEIPKNYEWKLADFNFIKEIGKGQFATVYEARHSTLTKMRFAIKVVSKSELGPIAFAKTYDSEISCLMKVNFPFIVRVFSIFDEDSYVCIVMEYVEGGTLLDYVNEYHGGIREESEVRQIFNMISDAIKYLHCDAQITHRDLKLENILLTKDHTVKIIDFGLSKIFRPNEEETGITAGMFKTICGSIAYMSPEMLKNETYTQKVDIWSLGIILYGMVYGFLPFFNDSPVIMAKNIVNDKLTFGTRNVSPLLKNLIESLLEKDPTKRPPIEEVVMHPWARIQDSKIKFGNINNSYKSMDFSPSFSRTLLSPPKKSDNTISLLERKSVGSLMNSAFKIRVREKDPRMSLGNQRQTSAIALVDFSKLPKL